MPPPPSPLPPPLTLMLLFISSLLLSMRRVSALEITSLDGFIDFTNNVNNGISNYIGETVLLINDLDMTGYSSSFFVPVGNSTANTFLGTFDGQGHVISNLAVSSDKFQFLGIFGYSRGATIKNLVVDKSCSFKSNYSVSNSNNSATGGILGWCSSDSVKCVVEGCINMAQITYSGLSIGDSSSSAYLGGIISKFTPVNHDTSITNCVNYGNVSSTSTSSYQIRIGGIAGEVWTGNSVSVTNTIKDCVNFGALYQSGEVTFNLLIGGISGVDRSNIVYENCVSLGNISYKESIPMDNVSVGSISGYSTKATITNCFWDDSLGLNATGSWSEDTTEEGSVESFTTSPFTNTAVLQILTAKANTSFTIINLDSRGGCAVGPVILFLNAATVSGVEVTLPSPVRVESTFRGWYSDVDLTAEFDASGLSAGNTTVYAKWDVNNYTVTFTMDGEVYNKSSQEYGAAITYPPTAPTRDGFTFDGWNKTITAVPAHNVTIESLWTVNKYTVTFIFNETYNETKSFTYNTNITYPMSIPTKDGFTFDGWNKTITTVPAHNITIESLWTVNKYTVTFSVDGGVYNESSQEYGAAITYPPTAPTKDGFTFDGWYNDSAFTNKASTDLTVRGNLTLYGRFISTTIKIEFITKDLSSDDMVKEIERVAGCTDCFTIIKMKNGDGGTPSIIVKFNELSDAVNFIETIQG